MNPKLTIKFDLSSAQVKIVSRLIIDLGKLFFAAGVVGFLFPGITGGTDQGSFVLGLVISTVFFMVVVNLMGRIKNGS